MRRRSKNLVLLLVFVFAVWLTGCGGEEAANDPDNYIGYDISESPDNEPMEEPMDEAAEMVSESGHDQAAIPAQRRLVIMNATMSVESHDPAAVIGFITDLARRYGGFVVESNLKRTELKDGTSRADGFIRIRVPADRLMVAVEAIEAQDLKVLRKDISGEDVTADYVDLKSRLRNLEEAAAQLQTIMDNATDTEAVLEVYKELTQVNEEAELVRGQILYYEEAAAMSSLLVDVKQIINTPTPTPTPTPEPWRLSTSFEKSSERMTRSFQSWLEDVVRFFVYGLPIFLLRAGPWLAVIFFAGRWAYRKYTPSKPENEKPDTTE